MPNVIRKLFFGEIIKSIRRTGDVVFPDLPTNKMLLFMPENY